MRALVLEGGAMRGIFTAGVLDGLAAGGRTDFDLVVGVSSGAYCAASFLTGQHGRLERIIREHLTGSNYANPWRMLRGGSLIDQDYLMGPVTRELEPLDLAALRRAKARFEVVAANAHTGQPCYLPAQGEDCLEALHATVAIPFFYRGGPITFRGVRHFDGSVADPLPVVHALSQGATELTLVLTRGKDRRLARPARATRLGLGLAFTRFPAIADAIARRFRAYEEALRLATAPPPLVRVRIFEPPADFPVERFTRDRGKILRGYELGRAAGQAAGATP